MKGFLLVVFFFSYYFIYVANGLQIFSINLLCWRWGLRNVTVPLIISERENIMYQSNKGAI